MPDPLAPARPLRLGEEFPPVRSEDWDAAVRHDLRGSDYDKRLVWHTDDGIAVQPYYRAEHLAGLDAQTTAAPGEWPWVRGSGVPWTVAALQQIPANAIRADRLHEAGATAVQEIGYALAEGVERLVEATAEGIPLSEAAGGLTFVFAVGSSYFLEIAKLRAARLCWAQAVAAFASEAGGAGRMRIVARTARANKSRYDPYTNLLRVTTEAMSAACGGADAIVVEPAGFDAHLAENVTRILAEESRVDAVADPAGGSYYVEVLTDQLGRAAWQLLQNVERSGGHEKVSVSGGLAANVAASRAIKAKAVSSRRRTLVGVNNYPDLEETAPSGAPPSDDAGPALPAFRMAEPFEQIRARTERHTAATGHRPEVLLLTRGDVRMRGARANFSLNFFGCAGFAVTRSEMLEGRHPDLVVLCSVDAEYPAFAAEVCPKSRVPVVVAGFPREQVAALEAAGVAGFVHLGSDAVETLTLWQDRLGIQAGSDR
jgi:methylmalonyl-CoA mutase